jgi:hypothetical protein
MQMNNTYFFIFLVGWKMGEEKEVYTSAKEGELEMEELTIAETGTPIDAEVVEIRKKKCKEFPVVERIRNQTIKERWMQYGDRDCIQLVVNVAGINYELFPIRVSNNPRSTFYRLLKKYGVKEGNVYKLKPGMKVKIVLSERGFPRLYIPE